MSLCSVTLLTLACWTPFACAQVPFQVLGNLNSAGISGDGSTVVGSAQGVAAIWSADVGIQLLGGIPEPFTGVGRAYGVSFDGSTVVGRNFYGSHSEAFRWTEASGMQALGFLPGATSSWAFATSADGSTAVGRVEYGGFGGEAFRWTAAGGMTRLLAADGLGWPSSWARGISADGAVIAGDGLRAGLIREPFRWTEQTGLTPIFPQPHTFGSGQTGGISADGSTIVGHATRAGHGGATLYFAFRWRADTGFNVLPFLPEAFGYSLARDVSGDGSVIIGDSDRIWVWDESTGIRYLDDILTNDFGVDLTGYTLEYARGISDDGTRITGLAYNHATGFHEAFIATIPGPATAGPLLLTMVAAWTRRPRRDQDRPRRHSRLRRRGQHGRGTR